MSTLSLPEPEVIQMISKLEWRWQMLHWSAWIPPGALSNFTLKGTSLVSGLGLAMSVSMAEVYGSCTNNSAKKLNVLTIRQLILNTRAENIAISIIIDKARKWLLTMKILLRGHRATFYLIPDF
jgi:hypothetical protein